MPKKNISKEDLKQVLGGVKSNIIKEMEAERASSVIAFHSKYSVDHYSKGNIAISDSDASVGSGNAS